MYSVGQIVRLRNPEYLRVIGIPSNFSGSLAKIMKIFYYGGTIRYKFAMYFDSEKAKVSYPSETDKESFETNWWWSEAEGLMPVGENSDIQLEIF